MSTHPVCLCGVRNYRVYYYKTEQKDFSVLVCRACGLARTWPQPLLNSAMTDFYNKQVDYEERWNTLSLRQKYAQRVLRILQKYNPGERLLDIGCNIGIFVKEAQRCGFEAQGIDLSVKAVAYGQTKLGLKNKLMVGTLISKQYAPEFFDVVTYIHSFEHIFYVVDELREIKRILKPGGLAVIETPNFFSSWRFFLGSRWYPFSPFQHIWQGGKQGLSTLLNRAGFNVIAVKTRLSMYHKITADHKGLIKLLILTIAWLTATGDNLIIVAQKKVK